MTTPTADDTDSHSASSALAQRYQAILAEIAAAAGESGRNPSQVHCLAVSKQVSVQTIAQLAEHGQRHFAESRVQEAVDKIHHPLLAEQGLIWHFIGPLQSNKTQAIAKHFDWLHSCSDSRLVARLQQAREQACEQPQPSKTTPLNVCVQLKLAQDTAPNRQGLAAEALPELCAAIEACSHLRLRGLMCLPPPSPDQQQQRAAFRLAKQCYDDLQAQGFDLDVLSMGMSADFRAAILEGATCVRIGSALFKEH